MSANSITTYWVLTIGEWQSLQIIQLKSELRLLKKVYGLDYEIFCQVCNCYFWISGTQCNAKHFAWNANYLGLHFQQEIKTLKLIILYYAKEVIIHIPLTFDSFLDFCGIGMKECNYIQIKKCLVVIRNYIGTSWMISVVKKWENKLYYYFLRFVLEFWYGPNSFVLPAMAKWNFILVLIG